MKGRIFISYSRKDLDAVKPIKEELESSGFPCWMDLEGIESGSDEFTDYIANAIEQSRVLLFFLSGNSQRSRWSLNELRVARDDKKHVVLIRFNKDNMTTKFKLEFGGTDIIDWRRQEQKSKLLKDLMRWLECDASSAKADNSTAPLGPMRLGTAGSNESAAMAVQRPEGVVLGDDRVEAEKVFLSRARRFKTDDGVIDPSERKELDSLADRLGISILRREALIEQVECAFGRGYNAVQGCSSSSSPLNGAENGRTKPRKTSESQDVKADRRVEPDPCSTAKDARRKKIIRVFAKRFCDLPKDDNLFVGNIPNKKRANAWSSMNVQEDIDSILLLFDNTVFGSASDGLVVTHDAVYFKNLMSHPIRVRLDKVGMVRVQAGKKISIGGHCCECNLLEQSAMEGLCKAFDGLSADLARAGVAFGAENAAVDEVLGCFSEITNNADVYLGDNIPPKKRTNAYRSLRVKEPISEICVLADATVFGSAEEALVVTTKAVYFKNSFEAPNRIPFEEMQSVDIVKTDIVVNGLKFASVGGDLARAAPILAKGIQSLASRSRLGK